MKNEQLLCVGGPIAGKEMTLHEGHRLVFTDKDDVRHVYRRVNDLPDGPSTLVYVGIDESDEPRNVK